MVNLSKIFPPKYVPLQQVTLFYFIFQPLLSTLVHWKEAKKEGEKRTGHSPLHCFQDHYGSWPTVWKTTHVPPVTKQCVSTLEIHQSYHMSHYLQAADPVEEWNGLLKTTVIRQHSERMEFYLIQYSIRFESAVSPKIRRHWLGIKGQKRSGSSYYYPNNTFKELLLLVLADMEALVLKTRMLPLERENNYTVKLKVRL